ncbi:MAG: FAD-binding oxidoreductase [Pseudomonadales bacterium]|nr:FAD-binding oxidoreductase [Pseudomonadales bacterium]
MNTEQNTTSATKLPATFCEQIIALVGADKWRTDSQSLESHGRDSTHFYEPAPSAIVFPKTIDQIQQIAQLANQHKVALVPSGGRTGLSGGAMACNGELVVSFDYMNQISDFDPINQTVVCQPGVVTQQLQEFAEQNQLYYPVDFASAGSSQIGGNIATNAGGIKVIRYGMTRDWIKGLKVVTGKGELLDLNKGLTKNATGYDLRHLFIGSEGTLGLIAEATIQLTRIPKDSPVLVLGVDSFGAILKVLEAFQQNLAISAFEFFSEQALQKVLARHSLQRPFEAGPNYYCLIEFEAVSEQTTEQAMQTFETCVESGWVIDGVMSQNQTQAKNLWRLREDISESISHFTPYKNDISVTVSQMPTFIEKVDQLVAQQYPDFEIIWFGHIGDGNLHLNILKPEALSTEQFTQRCGEVSPKVFEFVEQLGGSISAEHGVGLLKKDYLHFSRSEEEIFAMKAIKAVFDPNGIMNPGKLFDV